MLGIEQDELLVPVYDLVVVEDLDALEQRPDPVVRQVCDNVARADSCLAQKRHDLDVVVPGRSGSSCSYGHALIAATATVLSLGMELTKCLARAGHRIMVSYQRWTAIVFDVARSMGADTSRRQTEIVSAAATIWNDQKEELETATAAEAREIAQQRVSVGSGP